MLVIPVVETEGLGIQANLDYKASQIKPVLPKTLFQNKQMNYESVELGKVVHA